LSALLSGRDVSGVANLEPRALAMADSKSLHAAAEGFAAGARAYAAGRPEYPIEIEGWLRDDLGLAPARSVLDLGAGTGKFLSRLRATGAAIFAVEPVAEMRASLVAANPDAVALSGTAGSIPLPDAALDAIVCAQSFHWFATGATLAEIRRVLKTGGALGLVWNVRDESVGWVAELTRLLEPYEGETPRFGSGRWRDVFPAEGFSELRERRFSHLHVGPPERVIVDRTLSTSFIAALPTDERDRVAARIRELIAATPSLAEQSEVAYPYETRAFSCFKER
jgi:SAM-dependent methyltransferase